MQYQLFNLFSLTLNNEKAIGIISLGGSESICCRVEVALFEDETEKVLAHSSGLYHPSHLFEIKTMTIIRKYLNTKFFCIM